MNSGTITNQLLDAVQVLVDDAVKKAEFDRTVQAVISKCVSATKGQYSVKYQGGFFYAYAQDPSITYTPETQVYVLIPGNDMNKTKTILGTVEKLGENFVSEAESSIFENVGNNICSDNEGTVYGLHSYYITDNIVLYERGTTPSTDFAIDEEAANLYLKNSDYLMIAAKFRTNLPQEHRTKGNYGLKYTLTFIDPITGENIDRPYTLDINYMLGNPYAQAVSIRQVLPFKIDADNFLYIKKIEIFSKDFTTVADVSKPADIFISDIELNGALMIAADEGTGYILSLITKQGVYFKENDDLSSTRHIEAELYKDGEKQNITSNDVIYYWFKEDGSIYYNSPGFLKYGGQGWKCINEPTSDGKFLPGQSYIDVSKLDNPAKENNYKCVVVFKNTTLYMDREITIYNQSSNYTVILNSDVSNLSDAAIAHLTCEVTGTLPGHTITYSWSKVVDNRLPAEFISESNSSTLEVDLREAIKNVVYKCTAKDSTDNIYLGSDSVAITRGSEETAGYYYISMINDNQIFKYDTHGDSPTNISLINPQIINPLSFTLYDPDGQVVNYEDIGASNINWIIPNEETSMIVDAEPMSTYNEKLGFDIKGKYNINAINNTIEVEVFYDNKTIRGKANLIFLKEGENGSNGTSYYLNVVPNYSGDNAPNGRVFYYYRDANNQGFNFTPIANKFPFRTLFYRDGDIIYDSNRDQDNVQATITYDFVKRIYFTDKTRTPYVTYSDDSRFEINGNDIDCIDVALGDQAGEYSADILRCTFEYEGLVWYYYYPIIFVKYDANASNCEIVIPETSGFTEVIYTEDGRNPQYKGSNIFNIDVYRNYEKISSEVDWTVQGQIYTSEWQEEANLIAKNENEFNAKEAYNGNCVTNALYGEVTDGTNTIAEIHFPIAMYLNTYANEFINEWNGNAIELNEEGGIILTPQIAAGQKEQDNTFTGVVAGKAKESTSSTFDEGIFGYNHGERTFELNAEDGSARFGKTGAGQIVISPDETNQHSVLQSGNYVAPVIDASGNITQAGEGLQIDLTEPSITFGSGKFRVDSDGSVHATEYALTANLINGDYDIPSAAIQVDNNTSLADYVSTTDSALEDLQNQIDGNISTWFYAYEPTLSNEPASTWKTIAEKDNHLGDLFYDTTTGYCYRFMKTGNTYSWGQLSDSDIAEALAAAQAAQDTADNKRRVFVTTPTPPYDIGDLWVEGSTGDIKKCKKAKTSSQTYSASDWEKASKYTDDTTINSLKPNLVTSTIVEYALGTSSSTAPTSGWDQVAPEWESGKYMWQRTTTIYVDDTQQNPHRVTSDPTCLTGATGTGIESITEQYYLSTSKDSPTGGSWVETAPTWSNGKYIWTRNKIVYKNPSSTVYTTALCSSEWEAINEIQIGGRNLALDTKKLTHDSAYNNRYVGTYSSGVTTVSRQDEFVEARCFNQFRGLSVYLNDMNLQVGDVVNLQAMVRNENVMDNFIISLYLMEHNASGTRVYINTPLSVLGGSSITNNSVTLGNINIGEVKKVSVAITWNQDLQDLIDAGGKVNATIQTNRSFTGTETSYIAMWALKLEKGNVPTDWTPAPEDAPKTLDVEYYLSTSNSTPTGGSWSTTAPTWVDGKYMWSRQKLTYGDGTVEIKNETCIAGAKGATGAAGTNTAMVYLYGRFATAPSSKPYSIAVTYTFSTGTLSSIPSGWSQTIPSGTNPLYVSTAIASSNTSTASIAANAWTTPTKFAQDGSNGTNGISVVSIIPLYYLTISATTPTAPSTNHDNESTYPNPDTDVWTRFMPNYRTQDFYDLEKYTSTTDFPETGEKDTIYQAGTNNYYIWNTEVTPNAYTSINTFYCYDKTTTKYYYKATGANLIEINQRYRYFTCEEVKYSNGNHTWTSVIENKELDSLFNQTEAMQSSIDVTNIILNTAQNDIDELQRKNETQDTLNESFRSDIDNNFNMTITEKYLIYQSVKYKYDPINPTDEEHNKYDKNTSYYIETSPNVFSKINAVNLEDYWIPSAGDGSERQIKDGITLYLKSVPKSPKKPGEWDEDLKRYIQENDWNPSDNKPQWKDGIAIYACEVTKYGNKTKKYDKPYLLTDYQTIEDARSQEAAEVYAAMRGSNNIFYNTNGFFVYDKKTEDDSTKRIVINQNGINFATRLRFKEASNPDITNYPDLYYVKEKGLNIYYTIENIGKNYNDTSKYENRNNNVIIYEKDETTSGTIGWDTTSAWGIQGNLNLNKIQVINLTADEIGDGVLTLGSKKSDGKLIVQNDNNQENFRISTQRFICPIFNNSKNSEGYLYIGQDIGIQVVGIDGKSRFGNQLTWTTVPSGGVYQNNVNYYATQGDITSWIDNTHENEPITNTVYTCSCKDIFDVMNQRVIGDITFTNNNINIIKTITLNFTTNGITHQGLGFIKG